jgi:hypothetical protein
MGHFGRIPIGLVLPGLVLNYFGQGALVLLDPAALEQPVLPPGAGMGALASHRACHLRHHHRQPAVISGVFSVTDRRSSSASMVLRNGSGRCAGRDRAPQLLELQQHAEDALQLAVEMDLIAGQPLELVRVERLAGGAFSKTRSCPAGPARRTGRAHQRCRRRPRRPGPPASLPTPSGCPHVRQRVPGCRLRPCPSEGWPAPGRSSLRGRRRHGARPERLLGVARIAAAALPAGSPPTRCAKALARTGS